MYEINNRTNKIIYLVIISILLNTVIFNIIYLWYNPGINDSFVIERLGHLSSNFNNNENLLEGYDTFLYSPIYILVSHLMFNVDIIKVSFVPIIPFIAIFPIFMFSKIFFEKNGYSFLVSIPVFIYVFWRFSQYQEYAMAELMWFYFIYSLYKYYNTRNPIFFGLYFIFFLSVKFFGPPMEIWALFFIFILTIIIYFINNNLNNKLYGPQLNTLLLFIVIILIYNPKFYDQFLIRDSNFLRILPNLHNFIISLFSNISQSDDFTIITNSHPIKYMYIGLSIFPIILKICYDLYKKNLYLWKNDIKLIYSIVLLLVFVSDLFIYGSIGLINLRYIVLIYPIIGLYFFNNLPLKSKKYFVIFLSVLIILSLFSNISTVKDEKYLYSQNQIIAEDLWIKDNIINNKSILTDHYIYSSLTAFYPEFKQDYNIMQYTSHRYGTIINYYKNIEIDFDFLIINLENLHLPIRQGPPRWTFFEPLDIRYNLLLENNDFDKLYNSGLFEIYSKSNEY